MLGLYQLIFFICIVSANLEKITFTVSPHINLLENVSYDTLHITDKLIPGETLERQALLGFDINQAAIPIFYRFCAQQLLTNAVYEVRFCWPATSPTHVDLKIFRPSYIHSCDIYIHLNLSAAYFSPTSTIMKSYPLFFHITLDQVIYGIPYTLRWTILYSLIIGLIAWFYIGPFIYNYICQQIKEKTL
ncbi:hypothetical protein PCANB_001265 [Pneumocystis canis]|nr:hypothetical protein PCK1_001268 [Pneumocystis canis]KAG5436990.1 hypothetical protein PCANB_001265 [Pneumocystis canis]